MVVNSAFEITGGIGEPVSLPIPEATSAEAFESYMGGQVLVACRDEA